MSEPDLSAQQPAARSWLDAVRVYGQPRMAAMLFLGFSSGLPFYLVFSTLSAWLRQSHIDRATIGMLSWVGLLYSFKFVWSPVVDRLDLPVLRRLLGRRRSWMLLAQIGIALGLIAMASSDPAGGVGNMALSAVLVAFCAATQDIAMDAWRIETAPPEQQGAMIAAYQVGYRIALISASAGALTLASEAGWHTSYLTMAALAGVGIVTTLVVREPTPGVSREQAQREDRVIAWLERNAGLPTTLRNIGEWFIGAVVCPLVDFFGRYGTRLAVLTLALIAVYRLTEFTMGSMAQPFYLDHHYTLKQIALVVKVYGLSASIIGAVVSGAVIAKLGLIRSLVAGNLLLIISNLGYAALATTHTPTLLGLGLVNGYDNLAITLQGSALIAFLSSLTSPRYTATQYALFSSLYALLGKILEGFSGFVVNDTGYPVFFMYTASLSIPGIILTYVVSRQRARAAAAEPALSGHGA